MILAELLSAGTLLLCAILIKYAKLYDLMAGYNMLPPEEKSKVDAKRLGNFVGNCLLAMAGVLVAGAILIYFGCYWAETLSWLVFTLIVAYTVIGANSIGSTKPVLHTMLLPRNIEGKNYSY
jgi:hypothetical protein